MKRADVKLALGLLALILLGGLLYYSIEFYEETEESKWSRDALRNPYLAAEQFVNDLISSLRFNRMPSFRERYRNIDVLLVDDIQFLANKERTQEEFFHTFNTLYTGQKQIILSSDSPPRSIPASSRSSAWSTTPSLILTRP